MAFLSNFNFWKWFCVTFYVWFKQNGWNRPDLVKNNGSDAIRRKKIKLLSLNISAMKPLHDRYTILYRLWCTLWMCKKKKTLKLFDKCRAGLWNCISSAKRRINPLMSDEWNDAVVTVYLRFTMKSWPMNEIRRLQNRKRAINVWISWTLWQWIENKCEWIQKEIKIGGTSQILLLFHHLKSVVIAQRLCHFYISVEKEKLRI